MFDGPHEGPGRPPRGALRVALSLARRSVGVGVALYVLPPTGELPYWWQAAAAFPVLAAWCYGHGALARRSVRVAVLEAVPTLWMSLQCASAMVHLAGILARP